MLAIWQIGFVRGWCLHHDSPRVSQNTSILGQRSERWFIQWPRAIDRERSSSSRRDLGITMQCGVGSVSLRRPQGLRPASHSPPKFTGPSQSPLESFDFTRRNGWTQLASDCGLRELIHTRPRPEKERRSWSENKKLRILRAFVSR